MLNKIEKLLTLYVEWTKKGQFSENHFIPCAVITKNYAHYAKPMSLATEMELAKFVRFKMN